MSFSVSGAVAYSGNYFGIRSSPPFLTNVNCYRSPSRILDCNYDPIAVVSCNRLANAGVVCIGKLMENITLANNSNFST